MNVSMNPRRILLSACVAGLFAAPCRAGDEFKFLAGYEDVEVKKVEPDGVRVDHKYGAAKIRFENLPEDLQKKYGFKADAAKEFRQKTEREQNNQEKVSEVVDVLQRVNVAMAGRIQQTKADGVILVDVTCSFGKKVEVEWLERSGTRLGTNNALYPGSPVPEYTFKTEWVQPRAHEPGPLFVACDIQLLTDRQFFKAIVFPAGTYQNGGESLSMWTVYPDTFAGAEGLGEIPEWGLTPIEELYKDYPKIPRLRVARNTAAAASADGKAAESAQSPGPDKSR